MTLNEFQNLYPQGNLISELVQIYHGKYIVRASVEIEGVIRATGMAMGDSIEEAEDRARERALMVINITGMNTPSAKDSISESKITVSPPPTIETINKNEPEVSTYNYDLTNRFTLNSQPGLEEKFVTEQFGNNTLPDISTSNVKPFTPRNYGLQDEVATQAAKKKKKVEPADLSNVMAKIDVEMERLGWTKEQGRDYLIQTYGKKGRSLLTDEELVGFLAYLESQPTPPDPLAGF